MRALIVDDEPLALQRLRRLLNELGGVEVVGEATDAEGALRLVGLAGPDVLFLDIRMPGLDGLALAARYSNLPPVIFVTAHDEFALQAFDVGAVDYLLKPVRPERLAQALERAKVRAPGDRADQRFLEAQAHRGPPRVVATHRGETWLFDARNITRFWSSDKYSLFLVDGAEHCSPESLVELEARLGAHGFLRVHRGELVRLTAVRGLVAKDGVHEVELTDGQRARVSRRLLASLRQRLGL